MDSSMLFFFGGGDSPLSWIIWIAFFAVFFLFYPRIMISQILWKLEKTATMLEGLSVKSKKFLLKEVTKKEDKKIKASIDRFYEFFMIGPVSVDPYGILKKFEHMINNQRDRFRYFVKQVAPKADKEKQACLEMGFAAGMSVHQIAKIVRHYVEIIKKDKTLQIAMLLQMQLPMIERIAKALYKGTISFAKGEPVGDGAGALVAANLIGNKKTKEIDEDVLMVETKMNGKLVYILKAKGPGGRLGRIGRAVDRIAAKKKIDKIISIDAAAKLEGEKTGSVAEGIGVAMGGIGVERNYIEAVAIKHKIPLDSVVIKMQQEEAITPMRKSIKDAVPKVKESINRSLETVKKGGKVVIVGIGNTSGIGNNIKAAKKAEEWVNKHEKKLKSMKKKKKSDSIF